MPGKFFVSEVGSGCSWPAPLPRSTHTLLNVERLTQPSTSEASSDTETMTDSLHRQKASGRWHETQTAVDDRTTLTKQVKSYWSAVPAASVNPPCTPSGRQLLSVAGRPTAPIKTAVCTRRWGTSRAPSLPEPLLGVLVSPQRSHKA